MAPRAVNGKRGSPGKGLNLWDYEQRVCLDVLFASQPRKLTRTERATAFNAIFHDHQIACGVLGGLGLDALNAQYAMRLKTSEPSWKILWERVCTFPKVDIGLRQELQKKINNVLGIVETDTVQAGAADLTTPPVTPRRTARVRTEAQNSYELVTPGRPDTPNWNNRQLQYSQASPIQNPYATPASSARKRPAELTLHHYANSESDTESDYVPRVKKVRQSSPVVVIPPSAMQVVTYQPPQTTNKPKRRPGEPREGATMRYVQPNGRELMLKPKEHEQASRPLQDVTEEAAHPHPPAILFRFWHNKSHGINSSNGFISGRFVPHRILVEPRGPPDCNAIDMNDFAHHLNNRTGTDQDGIPSPFISTANNLSWALRIALKRMHLDAKLSIIDPSKLDPKSIFFVPPFFESLKQKRCFERGYFGYRGTHEHLIYHKIPTSAMVKTFSIQELIVFSNSDRDVKRVLRLDVMAVAKTPAFEIRKALQHSNLEVNSRVAAAVGKIVLFLGLDHKSSREMLSRAVFEVLQGWSLKADGKSQERANFFVKQFQEKSTEYVDISDQLKIKHAFLHGMLWSCGDLNVHLKGRSGHELMQARARKRGLADPEMLLVNELNEAIGEIAVFERQQLELHQVVPRQHLQVQGDQADDDDDEDEDVLPGQQLGRLTLR